MTATPTNGNPLKAGRWSAMPTWFVERGILGSLTRSSTARAFIAMVAAARWSEGGLVKRSAEQLAKDASLSPKSILRARRELARLGLVERVTHGGGKAGDAAEYRIAVHVERDQNRTLLSASESENRTDLSASEVDTRDPRSGQRGPQKWTPGTPEVDTACPPLQSTESRAAEAAAAAGERNAGLVAALGIAGVGEPMLGKLAVEPLLTVAMVRQEDEKLGLRTNVINRAGILCINLQARITAERTRRANMAAAEARQAEQREQDQRAAANDAEADTAGRQQIADMTEDELLNRAAIAMEAHPFHQRRWERQVEEQGVKLAATNNRNLRNAILARHNEAGQTKPMCYDG